MKQPIIELQIRFRYGRDLIYPVNETAFTVLKLMQPKKTFAQEDLKVLEELGFKIEWVPQSVDLKALKDE